MSATNIQGRAIEMDQRVYAQHAQLTSEVLFQGRWRIHILCALRNGPVRFGQLCRRVPWASKKALTSGLRKLEADGIVVRNDMSETILHVEYALHEEMQPAVCALLDEVATWGDRYAALFLNRTSPRDA